MASANDLSENGVREQALEYTLAANPLIGIRDKEIWDSAGKLFEQVAINPTLAAKHYMCYIGEPGRPGRTAPPIAALPRADMRKVDIDSYVVAGVSDHITPWQGCYETTKLYGERSTFVLANSGHIQSLINPPDNKKAFFWAGPAQVDRADTWLAQSTKTAGRWWPHWLTWITARSGEKRPAPTALGSATSPPLGDAPGRYVMEK